MGSSFTKGAQFSQYSVSITTNLRIMYNGGTLFMGTFSAICEIRTGLRMIRTITE